MDNFSEIIERETEILDTFWEEVFEDLFFEDQEEDENQEDEE